MTTPPLSLSSNDGLEKEVPLDIFSMPIPDAHLITRQETDKEQNPQFDSLIPPIDKPIDDNNINNILTESDDDNPCAITSLSSISVGLLTRQKTDDTPHNTDHTFNPSNNTVSDDEQKISLPPLKLSRQKTDDTPHSKVNPPKAGPVALDIPSTSVDINDEDDDNINLPPFKLSRQITDDTPHNKNQSTAFPMPTATQNNDEDSVYLPPSKLSRQKTDDTPHAKHDEKTSFTEFNLPPMNITRQITDKENEEETNVNDTALDMNMNFNLPPMNITRQVTDDAKENDNFETHEKPTNDVNMNFNLPPMNITRQVTDDAKENYEQEMKVENTALDVGFNLPPMNITRQVTDDAKENDNENDNLNADEQQKTGTVLDADFNLPPMNITRQVTDDAKQTNENDIHDTVLHDTALDVDFNLPPMNITRQMTDDAKENNEEEITIDDAVLEIDFNLAAMNITTQMTDDAKHDNENENDVDDLALDTLDMPLQITRQQTDQTDKDNINKSPLPDMNSLNDLLLTPLIRQQTDQTDKESDIYNNNQQIDLETDMSALNNVLTNNKSETDNIEMPENNLEYFNEEKALGGDDIGGDAFGDDISILKLDAISRQTTDMTNIDEDEDGNINMMIDQMDVSNDQNEQMIIKEPPSKVGIGAQIKDNVNNQYLDSDLLMFDDNGKLLETNNENENSDDVIEEIEDDSINQFIEHKDAVICMGFNPKKEYEIITGGQDENAYIWNIINYDSSIASIEEEKTSLLSDHTENNNYYKMSDHTDTIIDCGYNISGKFLATASMDSSIKIFNCAREYKLTSSFDIGNEISYMQWHPNSNKENRNILMAGSLDKNVWIYKYNKDIKSFENIQILSGHSSKIEYGGWTKYNNGINGYSGDEDGMIIIWENIIDSDIPFNGRKKYSFKPNKHLSTVYHESGINVMDDCITAPLIISGSSDYSVCLLNYENGKILQKLGKHTDSVECVKFNKLYNPQIKYTNYVSSSSLDGYINIWDLNNGKIRNQLKHNNSVIIHEWFNNENNSNLIVSGCMNGMVYVWDSRNGKIIKEFKGHQKGKIIQTIKITKDDKYIVSGSDDSSVRVWKL